MLLGVTEMATVFILEIHKNERILEIEVLFNIFRPTPYLIKLQKFLVPEACSGSYS